MTAAPLPAVIGPLPTAWAPTPELRFVERDGRPVLQQRWREAATHQQAWRDVPLESEP